MKLAALILWCGLGLLPAHASPVTGVWQYDGFIFQGHRYPNPNPNLFLTFTFTENSSQLFWRRLGEPGFCERRAEFSVEQKFLYQKVTWVNPKNAAECGKDPDMRLGSETVSRFEIKDEYLQLFFEINGEEFIYLLKRIGCDLDNG